MPTRASVCELCGTKMPERYICSCGMTYRYVSTGAKDGSDKAETIEVEGDDGRWYPVPLPVGRKLIHASTLASQIVGYLDYNQPPCTFAGPQDKDTE